MRKPLIVVLLTAFSLFGQHEAKEHAAQPAHAASHEAAGEHHGPNLTPWKIANFVLLLAALGYFFKKKGGAFFEERTREIRKGIDDAARRKADAEARAAEIDRRMAALGAEIEALRQAARQEMAAERERLRQETEAQVAKIQAHAAQEIASAGKAARQQLREYSAGLALSLAEQKIRSRMTPATQDELLGAFARDMEKRAAQKPAGEVS